MPRLMPGDWSYGHLFDHCWWWCGYLSQDHSLPARQGQFRTRENGLLGQARFLPRSQLGPWITTEHVENSAPQPSAGLTHGAVSPKNSHKPRYCSQDGGRLRIDEQAKPASKLAELCLKIQDLVLRATYKLLHVYLSALGFWFLPWQHSVVSLPGVPFMLITASLRKCSTWWKKKREGEGERIIQNSILRKDLEFPSPASEILFLGV